MAVLNKVISVGFVNMINQARGVVFRMKMFIAFFALLTTVIAVSETDRAQFQSWMAHHKKSYSTAEETQRRLENFADNARFVREFDSKSAGFTVGLNQFADLTVQEYRETVLGHRRSAKRVHRPEEDIQVLPGLPTSFDWRDHNAVTGW